MGGHSLGGLVAARYAANHEEMDGLVLLASYPNDDLTSYGGKVLTMVGSMDDVVNRESLVKARALLPRSSHELIIEGGNHAQFGNYGKQDGDGVPTISSAEQQHVTIDAIVQLADEVAPSKDAALPAA